MVRIVYILIVVCYCLMVLVYLFRYEISYRSVNTRPETVEQRDLTYQEHKALKKAINIRQRISTVTLIFSTIVAFLSLLVWHYKPFYYIGFVKVIIICKSHDLIRQ